MSRTPRFTLALLAVSALALWLAPAALAAGNDVGHNLASLLRQYAGELYAGIVAVVALTFLLNRKFIDLAMFFCAAILVGWFVFAPDQVANAARAIAQRVLP